MTNSASDPIAEKKLNCLRAVGMLAAGIVILVVDGGPMRFRVGGRNGAPAVYFAYLFIAVGLPWLVFAVRSYRSVKRSAEPE